MEVGKPIQNYENYEISSFGRIKSVRYNRMLKTFQDQKGQCRIDLHNKGKTKCYRVHRLVADAFLFNPKDKPYVGHIDGNRANNNVENLEWITKREGVRKSFLEGKNQSSIRYDAPIKAYRDGKEAIYENYYEAIDSLGIAPRVMARILNKNLLIGAYKGIQIKYADDDTPGKDRVRRGSK